MCYSYVIYIYGTQKKNAVIHKSLYCTTNNAFWGNPDSKWIEDLWTGTWNLGCKAFANACNRTGFKIQDFQDSLGQF